MGIHCLTSCWICCSFFTERSSLCRPAQLPRTCLVNLCWHRLPKEQHSRSHLESVPHTFRSQCRRPPPWERQILYWQRLCQSVVQFREILLFIHATIKIIIFILTHRDALAKVSIWHCRHIANGERRAGASRLSCSRASGSTVSSCVYSRTWHTFLLLEHTWYTLGAEARNSTDIPAHFL